MVACSRPAPPRVSRTIGCASRRSAAASAAKAAHQWSGARRGALRRAWCGRGTHLCARWRANLRAGGLDRGLDRAGGVGAHTCADRLVVDCLLGCRRHRHLQERTDAQPVQGVWRYRDLEHGQGASAAAAAASMGSCGIRARSAARPAPPLRRRPPPRSSWRRSVRTRTSGGRSPLWMAQRLGLREAGSGHRAARARWVRSLARSLGRKARTPGRRAKQLGSLRAQGRRN